MWRWLCGERAGNNSAAPPTMHAPHTHDVSAQEESHSIATPQPGPGVGPHGVAAERRVDREGRELGTQPRLAPPAPIRYDTIRYDSMSLLYRVRYLQPLHVRYDCSPAVLYVPAS